MFLAPQLQAADAPPTDRRLKEVESALEKERAAQDQLRRKAESLAQELGALKNEMVAAARQAQGLEESLSELEARLAELDAAERARADALRRRHGQMTSILAALQRLAWHPTEALIAYPAPPADAVRSAILLRTALPHVERSARNLRDELAELAAVREDIARQRGEIVSTAEKLEAGQKRLQTMLARKAQLQQALDEKGQDSEKRLVRLSAEAATLRDLLARLEQEGRDRAAQRPEIAAPSAAERPGGTPPAKPAQAAVRPLGRSELPLPARGKIVIQYGEPTEVGTTHKGITIETRNGAQVVAPHDGRIVFSGPYRGYGQLLIIEHGEGYHTLLAGMTRIDGMVGQVVLAGEPVGVMRDDGDRPTLYLELRRNGQPVNPLPWLTARKDKASG